MLTFSGLGPSSWSGESYYTDCRAFSPLCPSIWKFRYVSYLGWFPPLGWSLPGVFDTIWPFFSVVIKSNPDLLSNPSLFSYVGFCWVFWFFIWKASQWSYWVWFFLMNFSAPVILSLFLQTLSPLLIFASLLRLILLIINPQALVL